MRPLYELSHLHCLTACIFYYFLSAQPYSINLAWHGLSIFSYPPSTGLLLRGILPQDRGRRVVRRARPVGDAAAADHRRPSHRRQTVETAEIHSVSAHSCSGKSSGCLDSRLVKSPVVQVLIGGV